MALEHDSDSALASAVRKAGSQTAFGKIVSKRQSVVHDWLREEKPLPAELVLLVEAQLGISRHELRPDIYPREDAPAQPPAGSVLPPAGGPDSNDARANDALRGVQA